MRRSELSLKQVWPPYSHQSTNGSFDFVIGLRTIDAGKFLTDAVLPTSFAESMIVSPFKFRDLTWALMIRSLIIKAHLLQARNKNFFL